jgi:lipopolysaccharide/colanic/teichoic acid biosynthesis glycosyltransferase
MSEQRGWRLFVKQGLDRAIAVTALVAAAPVLGATALAIRATMGTPVLFRQARPGLRGREIAVVKFRTMRDAFDASGKPLPDDQRLTRLGEFLRATSLDELPQLWNVLRGELSLVGPRPLLRQYLGRYSAEQARRHDVIPGITGWAQVNVRNAASWPDKLAHDVWYVDNWSLLLDARILALTIVRVLQRRGVSQPGHVTMPEFMGETSVDGTQTRSR